MKIKPLRPSLWRRFRFWLWKLFHPKRWKVCQNIDEMHTYKVPGLDEVLRQGASHRPDNLKVYSNQADHMREGHGRIGGRQEK